MGGAPFVPWQSSLTMFVFFVRTGIAPTYVDVGDDCVSKIKLFAKSSFTGIVAYPRSV